MKVYSTVGLCFFPLLIVNHGKTNDCGFPLIFLDDESDTQSEDLICIFGAPIHARNRDVWFHNTMLNIMGGFIAY